MKFKIQLGVHTYYKTKEEVDQGIGNVPFLNDSVKYVMNSLLDMRKNNDKMYAGVLPDKLGYCIPQLGNEVPCTVTLIE
jgi:hypothetical protein